MLVAAKAEPEIQPAIFYLSGVGVKMQEIAVVAQFEMRKLNGVFPERSRCSGGAKDLSLIRDWGT